MELDDFTLPVEYDGDWAAFLEASQGGFSSIRRINLFAFRSPEPDAGAIRRGEFERAGYKAAH